MKKVLVYGMTDNPGGIEMYLMNTLFRCHKDIRFDFVTDFPQIAYESQIRENGSEIYYIPAKGKKLVKHWKNFYRILKEHPEYQKIYFNILDAGAAFTMLIPWILGRKIIAHSHNGSTEKKVLHYLCRPIMCMMTKEYVACSKLASKFMFGKKISQSGKVKLIPNAINAKKFDFNIEVREETRRILKLEDKFVICHVGRLTFQKNPIGLINIFENVVSKKDNAILISIGTGDMEEQVKSYVKEKKLQDKVIFLGVRKDIPDILQASDVFLLPSIYEGLPIVGIEAQASGLPCVMSDTISEEVDITGNVVFLSLSDNLEKWSESILQTQQKIRKSTREQIQKHGYDLDVPNKDKEKVLGEILG